MKLLFTLIITLISYFQINAQNWEISSKISPDIILISSNSMDFKKGKTGFGTSCSISLEYLIKKKIGFGFVPTYIYLNRRFQTLYTVSYIPEIFSHKNHYINSHGLQIPLLIKYHNDDFYLFGQYGLSYFFLSEYKIDIVSYYLNYPDNKNITQLTHENFDLRTKNSSFGHYVSFGFGKKFSIRNLIFLAELKYSQDIADWSYQPKTDQDIDEIKFKTHILSLSIGIRFKNKSD